MAPVELRWMEERVDNLIRYWMKGRAFTIRSLEIILTEIK